MNTAKKRILHITHDMGVGGAEQVIRHIILANNAAQFDSEIVCIDGKIGATGEALRKSGVQITAFSRRSGLDRKTIKNIRAHIKSGNFQIIHCHQYTPYCYGVLAAIALGVKVVFTEHGRFHPDRFTWKRRIVNQVLFRLTDHIVAISEATRQALHEFEWIPRRVVSVIYNGIDKPVGVMGADALRKKFEIDKNTIVLGTISRLDSIKNQKMMIYALHSLRATYPNTVLVLAGDGPERGALEALTFELGLSDYVLFPGFVSDIGSYLELVDIFLLTSFSEGASMTLLEAMAYSKPIVATAVGGNTELIESDVAGLLINSDDADALTRSLSQLCSDEALRTRLGIGARAAFLEQFTRKLMIENYEKLYLA